jgi:hypothetical protein
VNENGSWNGGPMVVVGVDGSAGSFEALRWALEERKEQPWTSA